MTTKIPALKQGTAYRGRHLFLPKSHVKKTTLEGMLSFGDDSSRGHRNLVVTVDNHYQVPKYTLSDTQLFELGCPVEEEHLEFDTIDLRLKPEFCLRENQEEAWAALKDADRGILNLACGKGKTVLGWLKAAYEGVPTLIVSPQRAHLENWVAELHQFFDFFGEIGWIQGKKFEYDKGICLATVQTLAARAEEGTLPADFYTRFGLVIYDECHIMAAEFFSKASAVGSGIRIGLTATPTRTDRCEGIFFSHLGPVFFSDVSQDLTPTVFVVETGIFYGEEERKSMLDRTGQLNIGRMHKTLAENAERNALIQEIIDQCLARGRTIYALSHGPEHIEELQRANEGSSVIHGGTKAQDRLELLNRSNLVFASIGVGAAAYNRKDLDTLILLTPFAARSHSAITYQQSVGRILRALPGKKDPWVFLLLDKSIDACRGMILSLVKESERKKYRVTTRWNWNSI
jgi:superfamily II DNA or RNA helicase